MLPPPYRSVLGVLCGAARLFPVSMSFLSPLRQDLPKTLGLFWARPERGTVTGGGINAAA